MSSTQVPPKAWYLQPFPLDTKTVGIKVPMFIKYKNLSEDPIAFTCGNENDTPSTEKKTVWFEKIDLACMPVEKVRIYWAPQTRCFIVKAKSTFLRCDTNIEDQETHMMLPTNSFSTLMPSIRHNKEKNQFKLKHLVPLPEHVCAKHVCCVIDEINDRVILKAKVNRDKEVCNDKNRCGMDDECNVKGENERMHRYCQPKNLLTTAETLMKRDRTADFVSEIKLITESPELYFGSQIIRKHMKEAKALTFPGLMKSPRFVKASEKANEWLLRIPFRFQREVFTPRDVSVKVLDEKKRTLLLEAQRVIRDEKYGFLNQLQIRREVPLPEMVDISKVQWNFFPETGFLLVDVPCVLEKMTYAHREHDNTKKL